MCHQSGGLIARAIEAAGVSTVVVMVDRHKAATLAVPRGLVLRFPFGRPFGAPGNREQQRVVLEDALGLFSSVTKPGEVMTSPYRWRREDYKPILAKRRTRESAKV